MRSRPERNGRPRLAAQPWRYLLRHPDRWRCSALAGHFSLVCRFRGRTFGTLTAAGTMTIWPGYAHDGATGVPDYAGTVDASRVHDFLYQWLTALRSAGRLTRAQADRAFLERMIADGTRPAVAHAYYLGVRLFGAIARRSNRQRDTLATIQPLRHDEPVPRPPDTI